MGKYTLDITTGNNPDITLCWIYWLLFNAVCLHNISGFDYNNFYTLYRCDITQDEKQIAKLVP